MPTPAPRVYFGDAPGFVNSGNPKLSALRVNGEERFVALVAQVLERADGSIAQAARELDVTRTTMQRWVGHYPKLKEVVDRGRERVGWKGCTSGGTDVRARMGRKASTSGSR